MSSLSYKPLRKSVHLTQVTDEEIRWKAQNRKRSAEYLLSRTYAPRTKPGSLSNATIVSDSVGRIANILLTVPAYYDQKNPTEIIDPLDRSHFTTLLGHLSSAKRKYTVLCHAQQVQEVQDWFSRFDIPPENYALAISVFNYSIWAQDAYLALSDTHGTSWLAEGICFTRDHDMSVADDLSFQTDIRVHQSHLYFQGGNLLATRDYVLVGMDYIRENEGRLHLETEERVTAAFGTLCSKPAIAVGRNDLILRRDRQYLGGGAYQPVFHIDMYVTSTGIEGAAGKEVLFVGSPALARDILGEQKNSNDLDIYFDEVADQLSGYFDVRRMPLLPTQFNSKDSLFPRHYYLSYNNALVESYTKNGREIRNVILPSYASGVAEFKKQRYLTAYYGDEQRYATLDKGAKSVWEEFGFQVYPMDGLEDLAMSWGSVHCMVKVLLRD